MKLINILDNEKGTTYQADNFKILYRKAGSTSGDNDINVEEVMHLLQGNLELTIEDKVTVYEAPSVFKIPAKTYHKLEANTDVILVMEEIN